MYYKSERARTAQNTAQAMAKQKFAARLNGCTDAVFCSGSRTCVLAATGLAFEMPVCDHLRCEPVIRALLAQHTGSVLFDFSGAEPTACEESTRIELTADQKAAAKAVLARVSASRGTLNANGELELDLKACPVGPHYNVNLLLGWRAGFDAPLMTTPKSAVDSLGRGSFRAGGPNQVLASRCVLQPEENGEPVNRQFYLYENGKKIFYSLDVDTNVTSAHCTHSQNRTVITYETADGLRITRTIFLLMQEAGMPDAVECQHIEIENRTDTDRTLKIVCTGEFGIAGAETVANDVVYANIVHQTEILYDENGRPVCCTLHHKPAEQKGEKKFAVLLENGETMDSFGCSLSEFIGSGTLADPELGDCLPSRQQRKMAPFFAMDKTFTVPAHGVKTVDEFVGMMDRREDVTEAFDESLHNLIETYRKPGAAETALEKVIAFQNRYTAYLKPDTGKTAFDAYVGGNLPFQVLYQTFVSRAFAWTQKSYRETGFREIQDIFASMYYMNAMGDAKLARELVSVWAVNVFRMGYAYHDFTWRGKEPGDCSDDQLWLTQAVYRYCTLTGDYAFLNTELPIAGEDAKRPLWETLMAILEYSGDISVGRHGLPLLDKADWNDTLRLDKEVMKGPAKEALYREQLAKSGKPWGTPLENTLTESVMNACLLKISADETAELLTALDAGKFEPQIEKAKALSARVADSMQKNAWKGDFFARALINDDREGGYTYLGAGHDGLSADPTVDGTYFLNSFGWSILAGVATEEQIATMLDVVEKNLKTNAGLRLCTLVQYERLGCNTATGLYYPGDRENGGVFKHAAMMSTAAMLKAAKWVKDEQLAKRLLNLAWFMIGKTLPYTTLDTPYITKGNPRFCTQYNNSETGENIGPMLSGTASWLTLALFELLGIEDSEDGLAFAPLLAGGEDMAYTVKSGDEKLDRMVNIWNQYQCMVTFNMSRSASYYESGTGRGMGFRDSCQDLLGFVHLIPARARERILDIAATQFEDGNAYHQYQPLTKKGNMDIGAGFNDDPLWLIAAVSAYIRETGDFSILDEPVDFNNDHKLAQPLMEHLRRSYQYTLHHRGPHGLPLIGRADWNDCLNLNCFSKTPGESFQTSGPSEGPVAESVFIGGMFVKYANEYADLCDATGKTKEAAEARANAQEMSRAILGPGWDGAWFRRAYDAFGNPVGSRENEEGQIYIEPQGMCVMAGVGVESGEAVQALASVKEKLDTKYGIVLLQPAYTRYHEELGEITSYPPGYKENAGIFCHNNPWVSCAETVVGHGDRAFEIYKKTCPAYIENISEIHRTEPYVYSQMVAGKDAPTHGEGKNSWLTGTAAWTFVNVSQYILGIQPTLKGLRIDPCIPHELDGFELTRAFRGATYHITVDNTAHVEKGVKSVTVNGKLIQGNVLPLAKAGEQIEVWVVLGN